MSDTVPAQNVLALIQSLRLTPPRLILSPPTQPRRASVALIIRMKPAPGLVFEGAVPNGYAGPVVPQEEFGVGMQFDDFLRLDWVNHPDTVPELLFIRRAPAGGGGSRWSSHIAFPGGRQEPSDDSAVYTALRETWEEIGIDLAESNFVQVGRLDEREITTSLGKRLLMILSPFVFLQTSPFSPTPELQASEVSTVHWIPMSSLTPPFDAGQWSYIDIDISTRLSPRNQLVRWALRGLVGKMQFGCILLPDEPDFVAEGFDMSMEFEEPPEGGSGTWYDASSGKRLLRLWGLSLGMSLDLVAHCPNQESNARLLTPGTPTSSRFRSNSTSSSPTRSTIFGPRTPVTVNSTFDQQWFSSDASTPGARTTTAMADSHSKPKSKLSVQIIEKRRRGVGPGVTAVFPRFSYPDVNFWIWVFGRRYRQVVRSWEESVHGPDRAADRRTNWSGAALSTFYQAVRHALVVAIIIRGLATLGGIAGLTWWFLRTVKASGEL
ncbi:hypothetical protein CC85DRAFT_287844 [Cutaneotrichosporon oleaginosum]|uniref:Nudix hydrolase domain-containing protein n=1 Tax=Cutaneotrichosporon oleaginosum TaxID=879819 RepID=A0A0J0XGE6_9TREE|nr:uncharacterized protein CC85DRAFT_287844 [Cutaneotrichosporon oleaginosum]KLT40136.1 hypothetical protein CC85DRAFT_287844 [Cutaneotrichosporon oleaginosum]